MAYNSLINRDDADALIPVEVAKQIIQLVPEQSAALSLFKTVTMSSKKQRQPVLSTLPTAYFVDGDTGLKQTTELAWGSKYLEAEPIACIVPIPEDVLHDSEYDLWGQSMPHIVEAIGRALDAAIFFGTNKPSTWPTAIVTAAVSAGNVLARGTYDTEEGGIAEDINQLMAKVEADGFDVNGFVTSRAFRKYLRGARATDGQRLLDINGNVDNVEGLPVRYAMRGQWPSGNSAAELIAGDFAKGIVGVREDISFKLLTEAVITDSEGAVVYNLPQQDMVALRVVARYAFQVANPLTHEQATEGNRYPFAVLRSPAGASSSSMSSGSA